MVRRRATHWVMLGAALLLAVVDAWVFQGGRSDSSDSEVPLVVTSPKDAGPGTLREALLQAVSRSGRAEIDIETPRLSLPRALPPLANPHGTIIRCSGERCLFDASGGGGPLEVQGAGSRIEGIEVSGAATGILVRASNVTLQRLRLVSNEVGVWIADGTVGVVVSHSTFDENGVGVRISGEASRVVVHDNLFHGNTAAGLWAVAPAQRTGVAGDSLVVHHNRFEEDQIGALVIQLPSLLEGNETLRCRNTGIYLGGAQNVVVDNRTIQGRGNGLVADDVWFSKIAGNELGENASIGLMMRQGGANDIQGNRLHGNGFGIVMVSGSKASPTILTRNVLFSHKLDALWFFDVVPIARDNRLIKNEGAGIRLISSKGTTDLSGSAESLMKENVLALNGAAFVTEIPARQNP